MRLLIIEDDQDGREMLVELFRIHGWEVSSVETTEEARAELRAGGFDVVISDEDLHGRSGSTMLREAERLGLLRDVGVIMYTAEPGLLHVPAGARVLSKPLGIGMMLEAANDALSEAEKARAPASGERLRRHLAAPIALWSRGSDSSSRSLGDAPPSSRAH